MMYLLDAIKMDIKNLLERVFDLGYADFFLMKENGEFEYNIK